MRDPAVSAHYLGKKGERYARWQLAQAYEMGAINARKFSPFVNPDDTVLDFGCGGGFTLLGLQCARRLGVDPGEASLDVARNNGIQAFTSTSEVPAATVDVVITHHALEHTTRPLDELLSLRTVLKLTGRLVVVVPIDDWRTQRHYDQNDMSHHLYAWTPQLLGSLLADAGFKLERIEVLTHAWPPGFRMWRRLPTPIFDVGCVAWAVVRRRRQIRAVAALSTSTAG